MHKTAIASTNEDLNVRTLVLALNSKSDHSHS